MLLHRAPKSRAAVSTIPSENRNKNLQRQLTNRDDRIARLARQTQELQRQLKDHRQHAAKVANRLESDTKAANEASASQITRKFRECWAMTKQYNELKVDYQALSTEVAQLRIDRQELERKLATFHEEGKQYVLDTNRVIGEYEQALAKRDEQLQTLLHAYQGAP